MSRKPVLILCGVLLSGGLLFFFGQQAARNSTMSGAQTPTPPSGPGAQLLHALVNARDEREFSDILKQHGPVEAHEVPYLVAETKTLFARRRRNAARALVLARGDAAQPAMRQVLQETQDLGVWAVILGALLEQVDGQDSGKALAERRADFVQQALRSEDPEILAVGLKAALRAGQPQALEEARHRLSHPSDAVRLAAAGALAKLGANVPADLVRGQLAGEKNMLVRLRLIETLCGSGDPENAAALRKLAESSDRDVRSDFWNGTKGCKNPWLRALLWELAQKPGPSRGQAIERLSDWGADRGVVRLCLELLEKPVPDALDQGTEHLAAQRGCAAYLTALAGRTFSRYEKAEAAAYAKEWLATNGG